MHILRIVRIWIGDGDGGLRVVSLRLLSCVSCIVPCAWRLHHLILDLHSGLSMGIRKSDVAVHYHVSFALDEHRMRLTEVWLELGWPSRLAVWMIGLRLMVRAFHDIARK